MSIKQNLQELQNITKKYNSKLIAVSKTHPVSMIIEAYDAGQRDFGENKVQELTEKQPMLAPDINWHLIGHLQRNKVKYIASFIHMIHSVDSEKLLKEIEKQAKKEDRIINCLLQVHIAEEETKFGLSEQELNNLLQSDALKNAKHIQVKGLMGMATFTDDEKQIRKEFKTLYAIFEKVKNHDLPDHIRMEELSMGMSSDFRIALEEGSTMVRVGSAIFGSRNYNNQ